MFSREAPPEVLDQLHEICPRTDLVYWGEGRWILGRWNERVRWNPDAAERLDRLYTYPVSDNRNRNIELEKMRLRGFAVVSDYHFNGSEDWGLVREDFRRRIFNLQNRAWASIMEALGPDKDLGRTLVEDAIGEGWSDYRIALGRKSVTNLWEPK